MWVKYYHKWFYILKDALSQMNIKLKDKNIDYNKIDLLSYYIARKRVAVPLLPLNS